MKHLLLFTIALLSLTAPLPAVAIPPHVAMNDIAAPPHFHQRLFDTHEVNFGVPQEYVARTVILQRALQEMDKLSGPANPVDPGQEPRAQEWLELLASLKGEPPAAQLQGINAFVNKQPYLADPDSQDLWITPRWFLNGKGDCEEYALTKYVSLRRLGFSPERLRVAVVRNVPKHEFHAVIAVYLDDDILILDNRTDDIKAQDQVRDLKPLYSLNENSIWFHWKDGETPPNVFTSPSSASGKR